MTATRNVITRRSKRKGRIASQAEAQAPAVATGTALTSANPSLPDETALPFKPGALPTIPEIKEKAITFSSGATAFSSKWQS